MCLTYYDNSLIFGNNEPEKELLDESLMNKIEEYSFT